MSEILLVNPRRRRRKTTVRRKRRVTRRKNPVRRRRAVSKRRVTRRRRRNPRITMRTIQGDVMEALQGATGALALDVTLGYLPIPANLKAGIMGTGVKALLAIGMGAVLGNFKIVRASTAKAFSNGALTVVLHDELKKQFANFMPNIPMGEYLDENMGYYGSGYNPGAMYLPDLEADTMGFEQSGMGEYMEAGSYMDDFDLNS